VIRSVLLIVERFARLNSTAIQLARGLEFEESRIGAAEALRGLIDAIVLTPEEGTLKIELQGNLAAMLKAAQAQNSNVGVLAPLGRWEDERSPDTDDLVQIMLVAGARNRQYRLTLTSPRGSMWWPRDGRHASLLVA
jgi:hypothetical protein